MAEKRVLLWDFDGTLGYRTGRWSGTVLEVLDLVRPGHGRLREHIAEQMHGRYLWDRSDRAHPQLSEPEAWWRHMTGTLAGALTRLGLPQADAAHAAGLVRARYTDPVHWRVYEDVLPALAELSELGWRHAVVSNHVPELPALVAALGLAPHLDAIVNSAAIGYEKPHPEAFRHALAVTGHPERVWMIGDNPAADVAGANAVGICAILVRTANPGLPHHAPDLTTVPALLAAE